MIEEILALHEEIESGVELDGVDVGLVGAVLTELIVQFGDTRNLLLNQKKTLVSIDMRHIAEGLDDIESAHDGVGEDGGEVVLLLLGEL